MVERKPFDLAQVVARSRTGPCFICEHLKGNPALVHDEVYRTDHAVAILSRYPTLKGYTLVAPLQHVEHATGDFSEAGYLEIQRFIYHVAEAIRAVFRPERVYIMSLGSKAANSHVHWHVVPLPPGVPLEQQQYYALMGENGIVEVTAEEQQEIAQSIRTAISRRLLLS